MKNKWMLVAGAVVLVIILAVAGIIYYYSTNSYVATVAGEKITRSEFQFFLAVAKDNMEKEANLTDENAKKTFWKDKEETVKNKALELAKEFKIQLLKAKDKKIALSKEDTDKITQNIDQMIQAQGGKAKAEEGIKSVYGINLDEYRAIFKDYILINKFIDEEKKGMTISDEDLKSYYNKELETPEKVTVRHILISTIDQKTQQPLPEDKQAEAKKKADEVLGKVKAGEDFAALAKQYSEDPGSKDTGGEYTFAKGKMVKEFEDWSFSAKPGDVGIVKTSYGYHIMKKPTFDELKEGAKISAAGAKYMETLDQWKKDSKYNVVKNVNVFNSIKVV